MNQEHRQRLATFFRPGTDIHVLLQKAFPEDPTEQREMMCEAIVQGAKALQDKYGFTEPLRADVGWKTSGINLSSNRSLYKVYQRYKNEAKKLIIKSLIPGIEVSSFEGLLARTGAENDTLKGLVRAIAWDRLKGRLWEWCVGVAIIYGQREGLQKSEQIWLRSGCPIPVNIAGQPRLLWYQTSVATQSGFSIRPDFLLTEIGVNLQSTGVHDRIVGLIECKAVQKLGSGEVWKLRGQMEDLHLEYAILLPFFPAKGAVQPAQSLRIQVTPGATILLKKASGLERLLAVRSEVEESARRAGEQRRQSLRDERERLHRRTGMDVW